MIKESYTLRDLEQVKVLADTLRLRILEALCDKPKTTKKVAELLKEKPTKLYHHVEVLERMGLIQLVKTRRNRGTVEKYYRAVAECFTVDQKIFEVGPRAKETLRGLEAMYISALEATLSEIRQGITTKLIRPEDKGSTSILARMRLRSTQTQVEKLKEKIQEWFKECQAADHKHGEVEYSLTLAFYPIKSKKEVQDESSN